MKRTVRGSGRRISRGLWLPGIMMPPKAALVPRDLSNDRSPTHRSVREILDGHVSLEVESIDRLYLNAYVPQLQRELSELVHRSLRDGVCVE